MASIKTVAEVDEVAATLRTRYHDFSHHNRRNPLDELLFILCSIQTNEHNYRASYSSLRRRFAKFVDLHEASAEGIADAIVMGGLARQKAATIKGIMRALVQRFGRPTLTPLHRMSDDECEQVLTSLPGVGKKVARCVMVFSLGRDVFPVDTNCWRICRRLGWVRPTRRNGSCGPRDMDRLQAKIPLHLRFSLHVNMVSLGRDFCTPRNPRCDDCPLEPYCRQIQVRKAREHGTSGGTAYHVVGNGTHSS